MVGAKLNNKKILNDNQLTFGVELIIAATTGKIT